MADIIKVRCPACGHVSQVPSLTAGGPVRCDQCAKIFTATSIAPARPAAAPPTSAPGGQTMPYASPQHPGQYGGYAGPQVTSKAAVASLVCGLVCVLWPVTPIAAIVCGGMGLSAAGKPGVKGRGMALTGLILGIVALLFGILPALMLPALNKARETANRAKCASNMHQIGLAILLYQNDNGNQCPPSLTVLAKNEKLATNVFTCPASNDTPAASAEQVETPGHCSYVYYGRGQTSTSGTDVILAENDADHVDGVNLLFCDGHVEYMHLSAAKPMIEQAKTDQAYRDAHPQSVRRSPPYQP